MRRAGPRRAGTLGQAGTRACSHWTSGPCPRACWELSCRQSWGLNRGLARPWSHNLLSVLLALLCAGPRCMGGPQDSAARPRGEDRGSAACSSCPRGLCSPLLTFWEGEAAGRPRGPDGELLGPRAPVGSWGCGTVPTPQGHSAGQGCALASGAGSPWPEPGDRQTISAMARAPSTLLGLGQSLVPIVRHPEVIASPTCGGQRGLSRWSGLAPPPGLRPAACLSRTTWDCQQGGCHQTQPLMAPPETLARTSSFCSEGATSGPPVPTA